MNPKVSIVVPIFNIENYLRRCLDSLLMQTLKDIEIIAVNDGSTDGSGAILAEYASKDARLVVIDKQNGGVSAARNDGILASRGDYIGFVDPDDWIDLDMYTSLYETAVQEKADIVMCSYLREFGTHSKLKEYQLPEKVCFRNEDVQTMVMRRIVGPLNEEIANPEMLDAWGTVWSKLYRSDLIKDNQIQFIDLSIIGTNEDSLFNIHAVYYAHSFVFLNKPYYHYWRVNGTSLTSGYNPDLQNKFLKLYEQIETFLQEKKLDSDFFTALNNRICLNALGLGLNTISLNNKASIWQKMSKLRFILNDKRIKDSFQHLEMKHFSTIWRVFFFSAKFRLVPAFYFMLVAIDNLRKMVR
ncbi:Glycosyltransferase involved in cell wall bisynthesis [Paenibacillus sp. 1_12]|uniref:glycosyltransferase n=1 Tax=Paenibacillus sp. 1_12 TaxID=1566278 RepID=UPI0008F30BB7|nr:glycosyltransferase [Paenibacillus sp. 1_12]SFL16149.1 Glycosyltransferase involved in cell wall bisynthesis [Paenibacillus sp. 1_12]